MLQLDTYRALPGLRARSTIVPHENVISSEKLFRPVSVKPSLKERVELFHLKEADQEYQRERLLTLPFRQAWYWSRRGFHGLKGLFSDDGFVFVKIRGKNGVWRLDKDFAWALENGAAFDRVVRTEVL
jgi:hypothetical protein